MLPSGDFCRALCRRGAAHLAAEELAAVLRAQLLDGLERLEVHDRAPGVRMRRRLPGLRGSLRLRLLALWFRVTSSKSDPE
jgi:hypothetical protein